MNDLQTRPGDVHVLLFSTLREQVGASTLHLRLDEPVTAEALLERIAASHPPIRPSLSFIRMAVNQEYVEPDHLVREGDEVALITPVSGG